jgi:hypothetical protein
MDSALDGALCQLTRGGARPPFLVDLAAVPLPPSYHYVD